MKGPYALGYGQESIMSGIARNLPVTGDLIAVAFDPLVVTSV